MAHECPDCGETCYCGSDIDDCLFNFDEDIANCGHCIGKLDSGEYDDDIEDAK